MTSRCAGEPISWLRLEQIHLGEASADERSRVAAHLATCPACAACLERIEQDDAVALPALPAPSTAKKVSPIRRPVQIAAVVGTLAAAAAVVLAIGGARPGSSEVAPTRPGNRVKGDAIAFALVRDDGVRVDGDAGAYREGDRFKALVTCAEGMGGAFDVVVYDTSGASFPLPSADDIACANEVPLPGAFRLTGSDDETVCLVWNARGSVDRAQVAQWATSTNATPEPGTTDGVTLCKKFTFSQER